MMTLIGVAITVAYLYSTLVVFLIPGKTFFWELATLIDVMLLGHWIEMKSLLGASRALEKLAKALPTTAHLVKNGSYVDVYVSMIKPGDKILVKPGEKIPVDGIIVEGETSVDESLITGESRPAYKKPGDKVLAGTINLDGSIIVEALGVGKDTYLAQVIELVKDIQMSKSRAQDLAKRVAEELGIDEYYAEVLPMRRLRL
nr:HAD-IC family P-type ATPase [Hyperthermus butylicus]